MWELGNCVQRLCEPNEGFGDLGVVELDAERTHKARLRVHIDESGKPLACICNRGSSHGRGILVAITLRGVFAHHIIGLVLGCAEFRRGEETKSIHL